MKKIIVYILALIFIFSSLDAKNLQKIYSVDSQEYEAISYLYILNGYSLPSTSGPWSGEELNLMLSRIDENCLEDSYSRNLYNWIYESINDGYSRFEIDDDFSYSISAEIGFRATAHTNKNDFNGIDDVANSGTTDWKAPLPLIGVPLETWIGENIYGYSSFDYGVNRTLSAMNVDGITTNTKGLSFITNNLFIPPNTFSDFNLNFPFRAFGAIGGKNFSLEIGREKLNWGSGASGNLTVSDHVPYHNSMRFAAFTDKYKYTFLFSVFPHPTNYTYTDTTNPEIEWINNNYRQDVDKDGIKSFIAHRLEWSIKNKISMAINEAIIYQNDDVFDFSVLSPAAVFHNYYIRANANSLLSFEIDYTPFAGFNIYTQFAIDDFVMPGEESHSPSAFGLMLGGKYISNIDNGILYSSLEFVYTSPYFYLRDFGTSPRNSDKYGINYIVAIPEYSPQENLSNYTLMPIGYRYGNDAFVVHLELGYKIFDCYYIEGQLRYFMDGTNDIHTRWSEISNNEELPLITSNNNGKNYINNPSIKDRNAIAHNISFTLKGGAQISKRLKLDGEITLINIMNFKNRLNNHTFDLQSEISIIYCI